ncbi:tachykinin-like peptides receptor 99D, partial [Bacillus rossius redtenbacheri]|uniref:tachykinin-like peptides receptor 99D n=1 Tax=Bacillus rossius redtenbacheri TaxID=93214 RepID=UPI002FDE7916
MAGLLEDLAESVYEGKQVDAIFIDFEKVFDRVPHKKVIEKVDSLIETPARLPGAVKCGRETAGRHSADWRHDEAPGSAPLVASPAPLAAPAAAYTAIMNPLRPRMGRRTTLCIAAGIWALGTVLSLPMLVFFTTYVQEFPNGNTRVVCYTEWPDGPTTASYQESIYNVLFMILTYFLPIGSMTFTYARVGLELWGSQSIGECTQRQLENIKAKRRVVKMMIVVVVIFAVCWLPFHMYFIITSVIPEIINANYIQEVYLGIYWLAMSNSMYNPIIYFWMNARFRRGFKQFFSCCPGVQLSPEVLARREAVHSRYYSVSGSPEAGCRVVRNGEP